MLINWRLIDPRYTSSQHHKPGLSSTPDEHHYHQWSIVSGYRRFSGAGNELRRSRSNSPLSVQFQSLLLELVLKTVLVALWWRRCTEFNCFFYYQTSTEVSFGGKVLINNKIKECSGGDDSNHFTNWWSDYSLCSLWCTLIWLIWLNDWLAGEYVNGKWRMFFSLFHPESVLYTKCFME